jgi:quercetin dioxygenase-like cupin family protein
MAKAGDVLDIELAGRVVFRQTAEDTQGELLQFDYFLSPQRVTGAEHFHPKQEERFEVVKGRVRGHVDGQERTVSAGESAVMPPGAWHLWWNDGEEEAQLLVEVRPALRTEQFYEVMAEVKMSERGIPNPLHGALVMRAYRDEQQFKRMQNPLFKGVVVPVFAAIGKLLGYSSRPGGSRPGRTKAPAGQDA